MERKRRLERDPAPRRDGARTRARAASHHRVVFVVFVRRVCDLFDDAALGRGGVDDAVRTRVSRGVFA
jgi:hypothetical protein